MFALSPALCFPAARDGQHLFTWLNNQYPDLRQAKYAPISHQICGLPRSAKTCIKGASSRVLRDLLIRSSRIRILGFYIMWLHCINCFCHGYFLSCYWLGIHELIHLWIVAYTSWLHDVLFWSVTLYFFFTRCSMKFPPKQFPSSVVPQLRGEFTWVAPALHPLHCTNYVEPAYS